MAGTVPKTQSEFQLYRVLQRANLLQYYDTFIQQGRLFKNIVIQVGQNFFITYCVRTWILGLLVHTVCE